MGSLRVRDDDEEVDVRPQKKKNDRLLTTREEMEDMSPRERRKHKKLNKEKQGQLRSIFKDDAQKVIALLEDEGGGATGSFQRASLQMLVDLIPIAETQYRDKPGMANAQAMQTFINGARELIADMEATEDRGEIAARLIRDVTNPVFIQIVQNIVLTLSSLREDLRPYFKNDADYLRAHSRINKAARSMGLYINDMHKVMGERITKQLTED